MGEPQGSANVDRLRRALDVLASGELEECPICFIVPASAAEARILRCCHKIMCKACVPRLPVLPPTCPFCRGPFEKGELLEVDESPWTYTTQDYSIHSAFTSTGDYSVRGDYSSTTTYSSQDYSNHTDYKVDPDKYKTTGNYTTTTDYSVDPDKYRVS